MTKTVCKDTLLIRNLPPELSESEKKDLLMHFGAKSVKVITSKYKQQSKAYAKFESEEVAKSVMVRLHQMNILESLLCVEYAEHELGCEKIQKLSLKEPEDEEEDTFFAEFLNKLNSWNAAVGFNQPPPPNLQYCYPKPNRATLNNIAHALAIIPKFYTQVLHLMNRMNLPPPFSNIPDPPEVAIPPPLPPLTALPVPAQSHPVPVSPKSETSESELESDPENQKIKDIIPMKRTKPQKKAVKKPKFLKPPVVVSSGKTAQNTDEVFEKIDLQSQKKIEVKVSDSLEPKNYNNDEEIESFGVIHSHKPSTPPDVEMKDENEEEITVKVITEKELAANRISPKDFGVLPVFKNYHAGAPSCRLYIKNLAKNVELNDLHYIYKRYEVTEDNEQGNMYDVRLLQEGRMKGQAFVTLQNVSLAQKAVKETNGFILKNKPLVVVFARSAVPKTK